MPLLLALALATSVPAPPDDGGGSDESHAASRIAATAVLATAAVGAPLLANQQGFSWSRVGAGELGGALGFCAGMLAGGALVGPFDAAHTNRSWILPMALFPPLLAEAGFIAADGIAAGGIQGRAVAGSAGGLVVGGALSFLATWLAESFPAPTHTMLAVLGIGIPLTIGGCMAAGAALATPTR